MLQHEIPGTRPRGEWSLQRIDFVLGALAAGAAAWLAVAVGADVPSVIAITTCGAASPALSRIDLAVRRLPNPITLPLLVLGAAAAAWQVGLGNVLWPGVALGLGLLLFVMSFAGGMGMGDVKLAAALVLAVSQFAWMPVLVVVVAFVSAGLVGIVALLRGVRRLPFGPFLVVGFAAALIVQV